MAAARAPATSAAEQVIGKQQQRRRRISTPFPTCTERNETDPSGVPREARRRRLARSITFEKRENSREKCSQNSDDPAPLQRETTENLAEYAIVFRGDGKL